MYQHYRRLGHLGRRKVSVLSPIMSFIGRVKRSYEPFIRQGGSFVINITSDPSVVLVPSDEAT